MKIEQERDAAEARARARADELAEELRATQRDLEDKLIAQAQSFHKSMANLQASVNEQISTAASNLTGQMALLESGIGAQIKALHEMMSKLVEHPVTLPNINPDQPEGDIDGDASRPPAATARRRSRSPDRRERCKPVKLKGGFKGRFAKR